MIQDYRRLRDGRDAREADRLFVVEGYRLCREAASSGLAVLRQFFVEVPLEELSCPSYCITPELAEYIADTRAPQGVFCVCAMPPPRPFSPRPGGRYLLLDSLRDPGNMGTVIRTAEAMGVDAVAVSPDCADLWSPKVLRAAMGSAFRLPVCVCELPAAVAELRGAGVACYAAALSPTAADIRSLSFREGGALVIGNEGSGVSPQVIEACGGCAVIPMAGRTESLNAAAAAAVCLWELSGRYLGKAGEKDG